MSSLIDPTKGLLFCSILYRSDLFDEEQMMASFKKRFGLSFRLHHPFCPMMNYYTKEMGNPLQRIWLVSGDLCERESLSDHKLWAHNWEQENLSSEDNLKTCRKLNCDVGLILPDQMILATGKPYAHRVYLSQGVYAELTYICSQGNYHVLPWTYPDYAHEEVIEYFNSLRTYLVHRHNDT